MKLALTAMLAFALAVSASYPRLDVLGGDARLFMNDMVEMWAFPGTISDYQFAYGQSDTPNNSDGWFGLVKHFGGTTLGVTINHGDMLEVLYHPGNWGLIVGIDYAKETIDSVTSNSQTGIDLAWGTEVGMFGDYSDLAIGLGYSKDEETAGEVSMGPSDINFGATIRGHQDSFINLWPIISAGVDMYTMDDGDEDTANEKETSIMFEVGAGHNHMVAPKTCVIVGIYGGVESTSYSGEMGDEMDGQMAITIPRITGGVEQGIGKFFVFRAGASSETVYASQGDTNSFSTGFETDFGIGLHWDNFELDAVVSEGFLHAGPHLVGGVSNGFMQQLSATYTF